ncbi:uncharacterized protein I303_105392 [Kwoniella dejecticola CBS 10117]|uniref:BTB domain-containing protein n=1 Tax=Kwoniella dejecticola CBS 10117 TaxID=1296121 RepID=A0A1A6A2M4_9TREE|nr:uncharacterized protein I303_05163 [Kwoniella dejecticola CBS 10117]OBR84305.1 hypothetical protein I303_05163 [Kwoniella dejecticola CBS 10117]
MPVPSSSQGILSRSLPPSSHVLPASSPSTRTSTPNRNSTHGQRRYDHFAPSPILHNSSHSQSINQLHPHSSVQPPRWWDPETVQWAITDLKELTEHVEGDRDVVAVCDMPEALGKSVTTSTGNFQLDLVPRHQASSPTKSDISATPRTLSLYITSRNINTYTSQETSSSAGIFVGVTSLHPNAGHKYAETEYIWSNTSEYEFSIDNEYASIELPVLTDLLERNKSIEVEDGVMLCVRIGPKWDIQPGFKIPDPNLSSTLNGLGRLLDKPSGDVLFVCLEHQLTRTEDDLPQNDEDTLASASVQSRKRCMYAHREILEEKSEYFKDLLNSGFKESDGYARVVVGDIEYNTLYWVLRFLYTNSLDFSDKYEVRSSALIHSLNTEDMNKLVNSSSIRYLNKGEWAWYSIPFEHDTNEDEDEVRTMKSASSSSTSTVISRRSEEVPVRITLPTPAKRDSQSQLPTQSRTNARSDLPSSSRSESSVRRPLAKSSLPPIPPRRPSNPSSADSKISPSKPQSISPIHAQTQTQTQPPIQKQNQNQNQISPRTLHRSHQGYPLPVHRNEPDPHPHPTPVLEPANPLEVYIAADKYRLETLKGLAKEHLLGRLNEGCCVSLAFATYPYDELHSDILDYIVDHWNQVKSSPEFLKCIHEVRQDVWGENGPLVLHNIYMRL